MVNNEILTFNQNSSFYAYLMIDGVSNIEREKLIKNIIKDSNASYLFLKNCKYDDEEEEKAFDAIKKDLKTSFDFLKNCEPKENQRNEIFGILISDIDYSYLMLKTKLLNLEEIKIFYDCYNDFYINNNIDIYIEYCLLVKKILTKNDKKILVDKVYNLKDAKLSQLILNSDLKFSYDQIEKLQSIILFDMFLENN